MSTTRLEVAVVPDFSGEASLVFEARALFLLASWLEQYGEGKSEPGTPRLSLHCIGEPPATVCRLAARVGASISVHQPVAGLWGGFANKLRGLEDAGQGPRLLLDADVLLLGTLEWFDGVQSDFSAAVAGKPRVPFSFWEEIYRALDLPLPQERITSLRKRLGLGLQTAFCRYEGQEEEAGEMLPYYNSGVLFSRRGGYDLRQRWEDYLHRILHLAATHPKMASVQGVMFSDQAGLATALQALRYEGCTFEILPDAYNVRLPHLRAAALRWSDIRLFHAAGFLRGLRVRADLPAFLERYALRCSEAIMEGTQHRALVSEDAEEPAGFLKTLWEGQVRSLWEESNNG